MPAASRVVSLLLLSCTLSCAGPPPEAASQQPEGWADEIALPVARDLNPDPRILEVTLEARLADVEIIAGKPTQMWTYDGGVPGPLLRARVGDRLIVHFKNSLPEPTSVHWHGLRLPVEMDGVPDHPHPAVPPGGTFDYDFVLRDPGTYWYHPHFNSAAQLGNGLFGPLIVDEAQDPAGLGEEAVMVLSDVALEDDGTLGPADGGGEFGTLFGREGNAMLVNGKLLPTLRVRPGLRQRWRLINAAKSRYFQLSVPGSSFTRLGGDAGFAAEPQVMDSVLLTPAQRLDVVIEPGPQPGSTGNTLRWTAYDRGFGTAFNRPDEDILRLEFVQGEVQAPPPLPRLQRELPEPNIEGTRPIDISLTMKKEEGGELEMGVNGVPSWQAEHIATPLGERQLWTITNTFDWDHPFHIHGYFFRVLDVNGVAPASQEWSDTVNVPVDGTVRLLLEFDERPGMWMFHCHILDHADVGMMGMVHVH